VKKFILTLIVATMAVPAFAVESVDFENLISAEELDMQLIEEGFLSEDLADVIEGAYELQYRPRDRYGEGARGRGYRPPRRGHRPPHNRARVICWAESSGGDVFRAEGQVAWRVQQRAMNTCYDHAWRCYEMGCDVRGRW
jgi:hypothetical protein